jgi:hypothetical protein
MTVVRCNTPEGADLPIDIMHAGTLAGKVSTSVACPGDGPAYGQKGPYKVQPTNHGSGNMAACKT